MDISVNPTPVLSRRLVACLIALSAVSIMSTMSACGPGDGGGDDVGEVDGGDTDGNVVDGGEEDGGNEDGGNDDGGENDGGEEDGGPPPGSCGQRIGYCEDPAEYCVFPEESSCGAIGLGMCELRAVDCTSEVDAPVCGCDYQTYRNACEASKSGAIVSYEGPCVNTICRAQQADAVGVDCSSVIHFGFAWNGTTCRQLSGCQCQGPDCGDVFASETECMNAYEQWGCVERVSCDAETVCPDRKPFCEYPNQDACGVALEGTCTTKPACQPASPCIDPEMEAGDPECVPPTPSDERVCGCDDTTYDAACHAWAAGVNVAYSGPCVNAACMAQNDTEWGGVGYRWTGEICSFSSAPDCDDEEVRWNPEERERCQPLAATLAECVQKYEALGCWTPPPCGGSSGASCTSGFYCLYESLDICGVSGTPGTCQLSPSSCGNESEPVCSCNDVAYENTCLAALNGQDVMNMGRCASVCAAVDVDTSGDPGFVDYRWDGEACVEVAGCVGSNCYTAKQSCIDAYILRGCLEAKTCTKTDPCPVDSYCSYESENVCEKAGKPGVCRLRPTVACGLDDAPVCGCDGNNYRTICDAQKAGTGSTGEPGACD